MPLSNLSPHDVRFDEKNMMTHYEAGTTRSRSMGLARGVKVFKTKNPMMFRSIAYTVKPNGTAEYHTFWNLGYWNAYDEAMQKLGAMK